MCIPPWRSSPRWDAHCRFLKIWSHWLCGMIQTAEIVSVVCITAEECTLRRLTPRWDAHSTDWVSAETIFVVCIPRRQSLWCASYHGVKGTTFWSSLWKQSQIRKGLLVNRWLNWHVHCAGSTVQFCLLCSVFSLGSSIFVIYCTVQLIF